MIMEVKLCSLLLCPEGHSFASFVMQALELRQMHKLFVPGRSGAVLLGEVFLTQQCMH